MPAAKKQRTCDIACQPLRMPEVGNNVIIHDILHVFTLACRLPSECKIERAEVMPGLNPIMYFR